MLQYSSDVGSALVQAGEATRKFWAQACRGCSMPCDTLVEVAKHLHESDMHRGTTFVL